MFRTNKNWIDFSFLFLFGSFNAVFPNYQPEKVLWILLALILSFSLLLRHKKTQPLWLIAGISLFSLLFPPLACFLPAFFYFFFINEWQERNWLILLVESVLIVISPIGILLKIEVFCLGLFSACLAQKTYQLSVLKEELTSQHDHFSEKERVAVYRKKQLIEKQNAEVNYAISQERNRIARDIHDDVGHLLSSSLMQLGAIQVVNQDQSMDGSLEQLQLTLEKSMSNIRHNVHQLHREEINLRETLEKICGDFHFCPLDFQFDFSESMANDKKLAFGAVIKESLNNVAKHSKATLVKVKLIEHPRFFQLSIKDNGKTALVNSEHGLGLLSIQERIEQFRGRTLIEQQPDGFFVSVYMPKGENE